ncbi:MAG: phosphonate C-P lyase system protein PhnG [Hyphomicrobiales bacterium]|nr:MAG: phosphonate C-P lyase system protein PhnG [Hyphomicrobiales bacterium]
MILDKTISPAADSGARAEALRSLGLASAEDLAEAWQAWSDKPEVADIRRPEIGLVMLQGRIGGDGSPFNFGETTVTRAAVRIGEAVGHGHVLGRDREKARLVAIFDALWQGPQRGRVEADVLAVMRARQAEADSKRAAETAATKVDFFTMVRGDD